MNADPGRDAAIDTALDLTDLAGHVTGRTGAGIDFAPGGVAGRDITLLDAYLTARGWQVAERRYAGSGIAGITVAPLAEPAEHGAKDGSA